LQVKQTILEERTMKKLIFVALLAVCGLFVSTGVQAEDDLVIARQVAGFVHLGPENPYVNQIALSMNGSHLCNGPLGVHRFVDEEQFNTFMEAYPESGLTWEGVQADHGISCVTPAITAKELYQAKFKVEVIDYQDRVVGAVEDAQVYLPFIPASVSMILIAE